MKVLILSGSNHGFDLSAVVIQEFLKAESDMDVSLTEDAEALCCLEGYDVCVFGTGFTRVERHDDGSADRVDDLTPAQERGLFDFVHGGGGLAGVHGTAWWIPSRAVPLLGGHANWHPPGLIFEVEIADDAHPITQGVTPFEVEDEIYMSAYDPAIHILAKATWYKEEHPLAWIQPYGAGLVFYTALGHTADTFQRPMMQRLMVNGIRYVAEHD